MGFDGKYLKFHNYLSYFSVWMIILATGSQEAHSTALPEAVQSQKYSCKFKGVMYKGGDKWYPSDADFIYCVACVCLESGRINCTQENCPMNCDTADEDERHECCDRKSCVLQTEGNGGNQKADPFRLILTDEDLDDDEMNEDSEYLSCLHDGKIYKDGETFTVDLIGLPIQEDDKCMQCMCQKGLVNCQKVECSKCRSASSIFSTTHSTSISSSGPSCCQRCSGSKSDEVTNGHSETDKARKDMMLKMNEMAIASDYSEVTFSNSEKSNTIVKRARMKDCISGESFHAHESTWHPVMEPFGAIECVVCSCKYGQINCKRLKCPLKGELGCSNPTKLEGHCCPVCPKEITQASLLCAHKSKPVMIYKSHGSLKNGSEIIQYAFESLEEKPSAKVDLHVWLIKGTDGSVVHFITNYINKSDFGKLTDSKRFVLLGSTAPRNVAKFTKREKRLYSKCTLRCAIRVLRLQKSLRIKKVATRKHCRSYESTISPRSFNH